VGLHQYSSEKKGEGVPVRSLHVPSQVPSHPQNAAKVRGFSRTASTFTAETDWLLEGTGFEPLVPAKEDPAKVDRTTSLSSYSARGTEGSNPAPSSRESVANRTFGRARPYRWPAREWRTTRRRQLFDIKDDRADPVLGERRAVAQHDGERLADNSARGRLQSLAARSAACRQRQKTQRDARHGPDVCGRDDGAHPC
jgi:hypothetical protein